MAERYVGILLEYESAANPEPGVRQAPTANEQARALGRLARRLGGTMIATATARKGHGLDRAAVELVATQQPAGILMLSIDALRRDLHIDLAVLKELWSLSGEIGLLIEDQHLANQDAFEYYMIMVMAVNHVRARDCSPEWTSFVSLSDHM